MSVLNLRTAPSPATNWVAVTPQQASDWHERTNVGNRKMSTTVVARYATDMRNGLWRHPTGEAIIFDSLGRLQQGQHRLAAVVESGCTITFLVVNGADPDDFKVLDQGKRRMAGDILGMSGFANARLAASTARFTLLISQFRDKPWANISEMTQQRVVEFALTHQAAIEYGMSCGNVARKKALLPDSQYGALAAFLSINSPAMTEWENFHERVASGELLREGDPAFALRRWAINRRTISGSSAGQVVTAIITKAWNAYVQNRSIKVLSWRSYEMQMPDPLLSN
jgi:hypothetical protein